MRHLIFILLSPPPPSPPIPKKRRLHYIPALRARLSTMEASTKQRVRREADAHSAEIRRIRISVRATEERLKSMEELNEKLINDNVKITKELDVQRTRYLDMKTANVSIVASLKKKDYIINDGQGDQRKQEERATKLANQLEQLELKHDVVLIQLANLRNKHLKLTQSGTTQNVSAVLVFFLLKFVEILQPHDAL
jgi:chromosome segregation ATPase